MTQQLLFDDDRSQDSLLCEQALSAFEPELKPSFYANFLPKQIACDLQHQLESSLNWQQPEIRIAGKQLRIPRLQCWQGDRPHRYTYSAQTFYAEPFHPKVESLKQKIEALTGDRYNSVLCNLYRNEQDSVAWHADNEPELGIAPVIASYSLGATRVFQVKTKTKGAKSINLPLPHNSLIIMPAGFQSRYVHQVGKSKKPCEARINLTFRLVNQTATELEDP